MFFQMMGQSPYPVNGKSIQVANLLRTALPRRFNVDRSFVFQNYDIQGGERPEAVANKLYRQPLYHWTILLINSIIDPYRDWPMGDEELMAYTKVKYSDDIYGIHHFIRLKDVIESGPPPIKGGGGIGPGTPTQPGPGGFPIGGGGVIPDLNIPGTTYGLYDKARLERSKQVDDVDDIEYRSSYPDLPLGIVPITNLQYEQEQNQERRSITVISPAYINKFVESYRRVMDGKEP